MKEKTSSSLNLHFEGLVRLFGYLVCSLIATARHSYIGLPLIDPQCAEIRSVVVLSLRFNLFFFLPSFLPPPPLFFFFLDLRSCFSRRQSCQRIQIARIKISPHRCCCPLCPCPCDEMPRQCSQQLQSGLIFTFRVLP